MFDTEEAVIESLKGIYVPNEKAMFGTAYHALIENMNQFYDWTTDEYVVQLNESGNICSYEDALHVFRFTNDQIQPAIDYNTVIGDVFFETPHTMEFEFENYSVTVSMRIDVIQQNIIRDAKCSFHKQDDKSFYIDSLQWKIYLLAMGCDTFFYDNFLIHDLKAGRWIELLDPSLMCVAYPDMRQEIEDWIMRFIRWCERNGYIDLITIKND